MEETPNKNSNNKIIFDTKINNELNKSKNDINEKYEIPPDNIGFDYDLYENSSFFSKLFFLWGYKILKIAKKYKLEIKHLGKINEKNNCKNYFKEIENFWEEKNYKNIKKNALLLTFLRVNLLKIILIFFLSSFNAISEYVQILLIKGYIDYFDSKKPFLGISNIKYLGISFIILQLSSIYINLHNMMIEEIIGLKSNYQLNILIYQKILKNSPSGFIKKAKQGQIINFIDNDSHKLSDLIKYIPGIIINPIKIIAYVYLLFDFFGLSFLFGLIVFIIMIGINIIIFNKYNILEKEFMKRKDERMKLTTETFENIKIIKLYNWESKFEEKILKKRDKEIEVGKKGLKVVIINITLFWFTPILVSITTIGFYQYFNDKISISIILVGLAIFVRLQNPIINLPEIITNFIDTIISMRRIEKYLKENDIENNIIKKCKNNNNAIEIENAYFTWGIEQNKKKIKNKNNEIINNNNNKNDLNCDESEESSEESSEDNSLNSSFKESDNENKINIQDSDKLIKENEIQINNNFSSIDNLLINNSLLLEENKEDNKIKINSKIKLEFVLKNINFNIKKGELIGIIGEVGSGKSSLLQSILNSLILINPTNCSGIHINGKIGYVSQINWIKNDTIKNNILFFEKYEKEKYEKILKLTELIYDLNNLEGGDNTEIGEKGINLSEGQKMRISLARSLYSESDIYLFDDPFSSLDIDIGKKIMNNCVINYLKEKTRIIVTNSLHFLNLFDRIYYLKKGKIEFIGTFEEIKNKDFFISLNKLKQDNNENKNLLNKKEYKYYNKKFKKILKDEDEEIGNVKLKVYFEYFKYMGGFKLILLVIIIMIIWQIFQRLSDYWLVYWSEEKNQKKEKKLKFFIVYSLLGIIGTILIFFRILILSLMDLKLAKDLHKDMLSSLIKAPINKFHEIIPKGQIYNRLGNDLEEVLFTMFGIGNFLVAILSVFGSIILCSIYDKYSLILIPFLSILGYLLTKLYLNGSRTLSRIDKMSHSPILSLISETIPGSIIIRSFSKVKKYLDQFYEKLNNCYIINISLQGVYNWYHEQFDLIGLIYIIYLIIITIYFNNNFTTQSVGIMFTYSVILVENLAYTFSMFADMENCMISMERCYNYTRLESEKYLNLENNKNLINWPSEGKIKFENFSVKYRNDTEIVLKNLNFEILPKEKIGICGRTGSGKSTICLSLFRIIESFNGKIYIDDIDISQIGLNLLRKNLTLIPQDPFVIEGTLKFNIDPFNNYDNNTIIKILKDIGFKYNENDDNILNKIINENNLSVGEKQLICITRAILKKTKIIIMDEATSNIDFKTEEKIQEIFNKYFNDCTVITIAHRIKTIINYNKILVLDNGQIKEFDKPNILLQNKESLFYHLYNKSSI